MQTEETAVEPVTEPEPERMAEHMVERYGLDLAHTRHVRMLACAIFDLVRREVGLPQRARALLEYGALLHDVGVGVDADQHHQAGRTIVLQTRFAALDEDERAIVACLVVFHRKRVRPETEPVYVRLGKKDQLLALRLAALLRVADGLDYSHTQTTRIGEGYIGEQQGGKDAEIVLRVYGPFAEGDASQAMRKSDLWQSQFSSPLRIDVNDVNDVNDVVGDAQLPEAMRMGKEGEEIRAEPPAKSRVEEQAISLIADDRSLAVVSLRLIRSYFQKLLLCERDVRKDKDIEAVHDMRVATRRLRAIFPVIEAIAPQKAVGSFRRSIQQIARGLGAVRDADVFLAQIAAYSSQTQTQPATLAPLTGAIVQDRMVARKQLLLLLSSEKYQQFKRQFAIFMTDYAERWDLRLRLCDMLGSRIWQRYEELRAYETVIDLAHLHGSDETKLHEARISGKRLRYLLDMVAEVQPGEQISGVLKTLVNLQTCLGDLQDIAVARAYIETLDTSDESPQSQQALDTYLAHREAHRSDLLNAFPQLWQTITSPNYQRQLMELIISL